MDVSENSGTPKSSILIGCSIINHPFWGPPIFWKHPYIRCYFGNTTEAIFPQSPTCIQMYSVVEFSITGTDKFNQTHQPTIQTNTKQKTTITGREWHGNGNGFGGWLLYISAGENMKLSQKIRNKCLCQGASTYSPVTAATNLRLTQADGTFPSKVNQLDHNMSVKSSISKGHGLRFVQLFHLLACSIGTVKH